MKLIKKLKAFLTEVKIWAYSAATFCFAGQVLANEELEKLKKENAQLLADKKKLLEGDMFSQIKQFIGQGGQIILLAISAIGFAWVAYAALAKFNECRTNKAEWAELAVLLVIAAGLLVFITLLIAKGQVEVGNILTTTKS